MLSQLWNFINKGKIVEDTPGTSIPRVSRSSLEEALMELTRQQADLSLAMMSIVRKQTDMDNKINELYSAIANIGGTASNFMGLTRDWRGFINFNKRFWGGVSAIAIVLTGIVELIIHFFWR